MGGVPGAVRDGIECCCCVAEVAQLVLGLCFEEGVVGCGVVGEGIFEVLELVGLF